MSIMANLVFKIKFSLQCIIKIEKRNKPLVVVMPDVVIDTSKMGKNPINFGRKVKASEQQPIKIDKIVNDC